MKSSVKNRNYRMFKKRIAEMDLYQEYKRSHERVKIMLDEKIDDASEETDVPLSAQENLQRFIKQHETISHFVELENPDQGSINLAEDTIPEPSPEESYFQEPTNFHYTIPESESRPESEPEQQELFYSADYRQMTNYSAETLSSDGAASSLPDIVNSEEYHRPESTSFYPIQHKRIEDELDDIIRDALSNVGPINNSQSSNIDPELLDLIKNFLLKDNFSSVLPFSDYFFPSDEKNFQDQTPSPATYPDRQYSNTPDDLSSREPFKPNKGYLIDSKIPTVKKQLDIDQNPPNPPQSKSTIKRPEPMDQMGVFESAYSPIDFEDDSSLAITKSEISKQVKNLIRESLEDNKPEVAKSNDLLELEKQLKQHIEKIKQSRKEN